jgi:hypothetical protein
MPCHIRLTVPDSSISHASAGDDVADLNLHHVAAAQLAVDREIEKRPIAQPPVLVEPKPNCPDLLLL